MCLCILTGDIVWINGPYNAGRWPDINIFRDSLLSHLGENERVEADDGYYIGEAQQCVKYPASFVNPPEIEYIQERCHDHQEMVNKRFKQWGILKQRYHHEIIDHGYDLCAVAV